ncbi:MAG: sulfotransferase family protein [Solirubrobacteraceae bacterium]
MAQQTVMPDQFAEPVPATTRPNTSHKLEWKPPERPAWVQRINDEGSAMDIRAVVPLDEESLLRAAMESTGLSDFGADDYWREAFSVFVTSLEGDADLNLLGRIRTRSDILQLLEARLRVEDTYKRHPEIDDEQIVQPIIIIGQGRSGTSLLQNVLAAHPENGVPRHWEQMFPVPPPETETYLTDPRIEQADALLQQWYRVTPTFESMHEWGALVPMEDCVMLGMSFMSASWMDALGQVASYDAWIFQQGLEPALRYEERVLKLLQWKNPRRRWVLKDPLHLDRLELLLKVWPDACFVWTHRDPVRALASLVSLIGTLQWGRTDHPFRGLSLEYMSDPELTAARFNAAIDQLDAEIVPPRQIFNVLFTDLVADPVGTVARMYAHFGIELTDEGRIAMDRYMQQNPRDDRPPHRFAGGSDQAVARARDAFARYQQRFAVPSE